MRKIISFCFILCAFTFITPTATASLITSDLNINGNVTLGADSLETTGNAIQFADMTFIQGGGTIQTTINNVTPAGTNPLGGNLTDFDDGVGISARVSSNGIGEVSGFFFDFDFLFSNTSATDTYQVFFELVFSNLVNADGPPQTADVGAFIDSKFRLENSADTELFATDLLSDTEFLDEDKGVPLNSSGAELSENGVFLFDFTLLANSSNSFSAELLMDGEVFDSGSLFNAESSAFIRVLSADNLTNTSQPPSQVPEPSTVMLFIVAIALFQLKRRANN